MIDPRTLLPTLALAIFPLQAAAQGVDPTQSTSASDPGPLAPSPSRTPPSAPEADDVPPAPHATPARFGDAGQLVLSTFTGLSVSSQKYSESEASYFSYHIGPAVDYFLLRDVGVGYDVTVSGSESRGYGATSSLVETDSTSIATGPRFSANLPLSNRFSVFPRLSLDWAWKTKKETIVQGTTSGTTSLAAPVEGSERVVSIAIYVPLLVHLAPHFFVGAGPSLRHELTHRNDALPVENRATTLAFSAVVGGWL